jgi:deoxyinosine 3'endonuclease (endonuclease V)
VFACVDVAYLEESSRVACVLFRDFADAEPNSILNVESALAASYVPGQLYRRELPPARIAVHVFRGNGKRPLFVTAVGVDVRGSRRCTASIAYRPY